jgi:hypothetical protein
MEGKAGFEDGEGKRNVVEFLNGKLWLPGITREFLASDFFKKKKQH